MEPFDEERCRSVKSRHEQSRQCPYRPLPPGIFCGTHARAVQRVLYRDQGAVSSNPGPVSPTCPIHAASPVSSVASYYWPEWRTTRSPPETGAGSERCSLPTRDATRVAVTAQRLQKRASPSPPYDEATVARLLEQEYQEALTTCSGPAVLNRALCNNTTDFYDLVELSEIDDEYFFSFRCTDGMIYGVDFRSLYHYLQSQSQYHDENRPPDPPTNPYNRAPFTSTTLEAYRQRLDIMERFGLTLEYPDGSEFLTVSQRFQQRVLKTFQVMNGHGFLLSHSEFLSLRLSGLKALYHALEDIWNFRACLNTSAKEAILPGLRVDYFLNRREERFLGRLAFAQAQERVFSKIETLATRAHSKQCQINGVIVIVQAFAQISPTVASAYPGFT